MTPYASPRIKVGDNASALRSTNRDFLGIPRRYENPNRKICDLQRTLVRAVRVRESLRNLAASDNDPLDSH